MKNYIEERPWGKFEILVDDSDCKVKKITVKPGERLSYQYHHKRNEVWTIVSGNATMTYNFQVRTDNNNSDWRPQTSMSLTVIEVASGVDQTS